ncbi:hypothetical protein BGZ97_013202 [Linnemannia gamsii]|jgi:hypothetical protein|uniref:F-box domain-containing protein n=1 Tax=Linnemannia gamsii TaxID=64522 RepID=A0A9P6UKN0_9FUNG|nr:hypothetical protein BGZ97_013202 [Linnemannia gamsii]
MHTSPLDLPEIVARIGHFLPLWTLELSEVTDRRETVFNPKTFHVCMLVCQLWRQTLLPILWTDYDAEGMRQVPQDVLTRNSHYFRTFLLQMGATCSIFSCTRLVIAKLHPDVLNMDDLRQMIRSNPGLKSLDWDNFTCKCTLEPDDLSQLSQLETLTLSDWDDSDPDSLGKALAPLAASLKELHLGAFAGAIGGRDLDEGLQGEGKLSEESNDVYSLGNIPLLPLMEYLRAVGFLYGPDPFGFIRRCPNIVRLDLTLHEETIGIESRLPSRHIFDSISRHCPRLNSLALRGLNQDHMEALIRDCAATNSLSELTVVVRSVSQTTIDSIALHASTLETLGILNTTDDDADLDLLFQLPVRCPRLKWLSVAAWSCTETAGRTVLDALKTSSWRCHELEVLDVDVIEPDNKTDSGDTMGLVAIFADGPIQGWYHHPEILGDDYDYSMSEVFVRDLFEVVREFQHLRQLRWCGAMFTRSSHPASAAFDGVPFLHFD